MLIQFAQLILLQKIKNICLLSCLNFQIYQLYLHICPNITFNEKIYINNKIKKIILLLVQRIIFFLIFIYKNHKQIYSQACNYWILFNIKFSCKYLQESQILELAKRNLLTNQKNTVRIKIQNKNQSIISIIYQYLNKILVYYFSNYTNIQIKYQDTKITNKLFPKHNTTGLNKHYKSFYYKLLVEKFHKNQKYWNQLNQMQFPHQLKKLQQPNYLMKNYQQKLQIQEQQEFQNSLL
eukprot:TRINITY_DN5627_c0_g1_i1.p2 TRINITY_DN5627_c0_g1~~TRINITY_DN5627_c0_g1_i1.p2  ORF type:complete len:237 (-),score=-30.22 TRINITY_DN5627_c0_g1_i1:446-1156(-)